MADRNETNLLIDSYLSTRGICRCRLNFMPDLQGNCIYHVTFTIKKSFIRRDVEGHERLVIRLGISSMY